MTKTFKLPDLGEGLHEAEIQDVVVSVNDQVQEGDVILLVETDKATVEIPSPFTGMVQEIKVKSGDVVDVGEEVMVFDLDGGEKRKISSPTAKQKQRKSKQEEEARPAKKKTPKQDGVPIPASPATRRLARELDVDIHQVTPSGDHGRVTSQDVRSYAEEGGKPQEEKQAAGREEAEKKRGEKVHSLKVPGMEFSALPDFSHWGEVERMELQSVRRTIAHKMVQSWAQIPHVSHRDMADITELEHIRRDAKEEVEVKNLTLTAFVMKAAVAALKEYPRFNASLDMESEELILKHYHNLGVAVDTERGLIVPVIHDVDEKSIEELSVELDGLVRRTREGEVGLDDLQGGTFTITNIGALGGVDFTPIINYPQAAILGVASANWQVIVRPVDGNAFEIEPRYILPLILTFDHRIVDGADAARFLSMVIDMLEDPQKLLLKI